MKKLLTVLTILALSIIFVQCSYSALDDKSDRLSTEQSNVFSPGYINAVKQHTDEVIRQAEQHARTIDTKLDDMKNKVSNEVTKDAADKPALELKKKSSSGENKAKNVTAQSVPKTVDMLVNSSQYNVQIGKGVNQEFDRSGRLIAEELNGVRCIYAGFDNVGLSSLPNAIAIAKSGDTIIIKGGVYDYGNYSPGNGSYAGPGTIYVPNGVSLYGGYYEDGVRDLVNNPTLINDTLYIGSPWDRTGQASEINGLTIGNWAGYSDWVYVQGTDITFLNNTFKNGAVLGINGGSWAETDITIKNNTFDGIAINAWGSLNNIIFENNTVADGWQTWPQGWSSTWIVSAWGGANILSMNNNYISQYGLTSWGGASITSENDYYLIKNGLGAASIINQAISPNTQNNDSQILVHSLIDNNSMLSANYNTYQPADEAMLSHNNINDKEYSNSEFDVIDGNKGIGNIFKTLFENKNKLDFAFQGESDPGLLVKMKEDSFEKSALSLPVSGVNNQDVNFALKLADIIKNPTSDQKFMLDTITSLLNDVNKQEKDSASPEAIKKASDDLLQAVANILIAQAIPDLLKEGDVAAIKGTFTELNTTKTKIMVDYQESVKPYYDEMKKILSKNMAILQLNNIVSKTMIKDKLDPSDIDKILEKLRKASDRSFEEDYILQQEAKYHKTYIEPNKKIMEEKMKAMMKDFTRRMSKMLETVKK